MESSSNSNFLMEYEALKSRESIFKMKEMNFVRDKEILEESIKHLQSELQDKSIENRHLRRELEGYSDKSKIDILDKCQKIDNLQIRIDELTKQNVILDESFKEYNNQNKLTINEYEKQKESYEKEIECKNKLVEYFENGFKQKEKKTCLLIDELNNLKSKHLKLESDFDKKLHCYNNLLTQFNSYKQEIEVKLSENNEEVNKMQSQIHHLQQSGISEQDLEKINPKVANILRIMKSSTSLMEIYTNLHTTMSENDGLTGKINDLTKKLNNTNEKLTETQNKLSSIKSQYKVLSDENNILRQRILVLVDEANNSILQKENAERHLLLSNKHNEENEREIKHLNEQIRLLLVSVESGMDIKKEEVNEDSDFIYSVGELQELTRKLRTENDNLRDQLMNNDEKRYKDKCVELESYCQRITNEYEQVNQERNLYRAHAELHKKQVELLSSGVIRKSQMKDTIEQNNNGVDEEHSNVSVEITETLQTASESNKDTEQCEDEKIAQLEQEITEILDNKRTSDLIYQETIEDLRVQLKKYFEQFKTQEKKSDDLEIKYNEALEDANRYHRECDLLRNLNSNYSSASGQLEHQLNDYRVKYDNLCDSVGKLKHQLDVARCQLEQARQNELNLKQDKEELHKRWLSQGTLVSNINSVCSGITLQDQLQRSQMAKQITCLNQEVEQSKQQLSDVQQQLEDSMRSNSLLREQYDGLEQELRQYQVEKSDFECQVELAIVSENIEADHNRIYELQFQLEQHQQEAQQNIKQLSDQIEQLKFQVHELESDNQELKKNCEFSQNQIVLLENARQEIISENIKVTEENEKNTNELRHQLKQAHDHLNIMTIRLQEAEQVEHSVQSVIDKYVAESNDAKVKYQRELTLHAQDSKLIKQAHQQIDQLKSQYDTTNEKLVQTQQLLNAANENYQKLEEKQLSKVRELQTKMQESETRNDRLYKQLCDITSGTPNNEYSEIIEDLLNQVNVLKMTNTISSTKLDRYKVQFDQLRGQLDTLVAASQNQEKPDHMSHIDSFGDANQSTASVTTGDLDIEVIQDSNYILRKQKSILEQENIQLKNQIEELEDKLSKTSNDLDRLKLRCSELDISKSELEADRTRWKERCAKLMERAEQLDPEQYRLVCNERDKLKKNIAGLDLELTEAKSILNSTKYDLKSVNDQLSDKTEQFEQQALTVLQLKGIAKKYKAETGRIEEELNQLNEQMSSLQQHNTQLQQQLRQADLRVEEIIKNLTDSQQQEKEYLEQIKELERRKCSLIEELENLTGLMSDKEKQIEEFNGKYKDLELQLNQKSVDCEELKLEIGKVYQQVQDYQNQYLELERKLRSTQSLVDWMRTQQVSNMNKRALEENNTEDEEVARKKIKIEKESDNNDVKTERSAEEMEVAVDALEVIQEKVVKESNENEEGSKDIEEEYENFVANLSIDKELSNDEFENNNDFQNLLELCDNQDLEENMNKDNNVEEMDENDSEGGDYNELEEENNSEESESEVIELDDSKEENEAVEDNEDEIINLDVSNEDEISELDESKEDVDEQNEDEMSELDESKDVEEENADEMFELDESKEDVEQNEDEMLELDESKDVEEENADEMLELDESKEDVEQNEDEMLELDESQEDVEEENEDEMFELDESKEDVEEQNVDEMFELNESNEDVEEDSEFMKDDAEEDDETGVVVIESSDEEKQSQNQSEENNYDQMISSIEANLAGDKGLSASGNYADSMVNIGTVNESHSDYGNEAQTGAGSNEDEVVNSTGNNDQVVGSNTASSPCGNQESNLSKSYEVDEDLSNNQLEQINNNNLSEAIDSNIASSSSSGTPTRVLRRSLRKLKRFKR